MSRISTLGFLTENDGRPWMVGASGVPCREGGKGGGRTRGEDSPKGLHLPWLHILCMFTAASPPTTPTEMPLSLWLG